MAAALHEWNVGTNEVLITTRQAGEALDHKAISLRRFLHKTMSRR